VPFDVGGWESGGFFVQGPHRFRLWVPAGTRLDPRWGLAIRDDVSPRGSMALLNGIPMLQLSEQGHVVFPPRGIARR